MPARHLVNRQYLPSPYFAMPGSARVGDLVEVLETDSAAEPPAARIVRVRGAPVALAGGTTRTPT